MLRSLGLLCLLIFHPAHANKTNFSATCPNDWSVDSTENVLHCITPQPASLAPVKCEVSSCGSFPVCTDCTTLSNQETSDEVTCKKGYQVINEDDVNYTLCIDETETKFSCKNHPSTPLSCTNCRFDTAPFKVQLQKRAIMNGGGFSSEGGSKGFGESLQW